MTLLASVADVTALGVVAEESAITAALTKASARFRSEALNNITPQAYDVVLRQYGGHVRLPRTPVVSIDEVRLLNSNGTDGAAWDDSYRAMGRRIMKSRRLYRSRLPLWT